MALFTDGQGPLLSEDDATGLLGITLRKLRYLKRLGHIRPTKGKFYLVPLVQGYCRFTRALMMTKVELAKLLGIPTKELAKIAAGGRFAPNEAGLYQASVCVPAIISWAKGDSVRRTVGSEFRGEDFNALNLEFSDEDFNTFNEQLDAWLDEHFSGSEDKSEI